MVARSDPAVPRRLGREGLLAPQVGVAVQGLGRLRPDDRLGRPDDCDLETAVAPVRDAVVAGIAGLLLLGGPPLEAAADTVARAGIHGHRDGVVLVARVRAGRVRQDVEARLRRLRTDRLDLVAVQLRRASARGDGRGSGAAAEAAAEVEELVVEGSVRFFGLATPTPAELRRAHAAFPVSSVVGDWSLLHRDPERQLVPAARELGVGIIATRPLAGGRLARRVPFEDRPGEAVFDQAERLAAELSIGVARLSLAWLLSRGEDVVVAPGTRSRIHLELNASVPALLATPGVAGRLRELDPGPPPPAGPSNSSDSRTDGEPGT